MKKMFNALGLLALVASTSAFAQGGPQGGPPAFSDIDTDGDGYISQSEAKGPLAENFSKLDTDGDGYLSESDIPEPPEGGRQ
ncbi:EF-hand domain-containing protein [Psychromonas sp. SP041]|uniref:EF-hand domain-containing protein n=1 Tax=Psychromonas sp. SP041 TaxID=1365007 RepID=UPI0010C79312|nr:EF-hand domain-containing protein [Psychromonas sp. SP041]